MMVHTLQMCILDGNAYDAKCLEAGVERDDDLDSCSLLLNNKTTPLLQPGGSGAHTNDHKVLVQLSVSSAYLLCSELVPSAGLSAGMCEGGGAECMVPCAG